MALCHGGKPKKENLINPHQSKRVPFPGPKTRIFLCQSFLSVPLPFPIPILPFCLAHFHTVPPVTQPFFPSQSIPHHLFHNTSLHHNTKYFGNHFSDCVQIYTLTLYHQTVKQILFTTWVHHRFIPPALKPPPSLLQTTLFFPFLQTTPYRPTRAFLLNSSNYLHTYRQ